MNFYNEFDPHAAAWLRELIAQNLIPAGVVDERSITDIQPHELTEYTQCHFFAGIGGWSLALELAEVDPTRPLWTGLCPCQPYSAAGKGLGDEDPRNLWPAFFRLIRECRPVTVFGEQVESAIGHGWLDGISADLEGEGYACGSTVLGAHSLFAPHIRQRLYWVADAELARWQEAGMRLEIDTGGQPEQRFSPCRLADGERPRLQGHTWDGDRGNQPRRIDPDAPGSTAEGGATSGGLGNSTCHNEQRHRFTGESERRIEPVGGSSAWSDSYWLLFRDGKHRRVPTEPALFPLADGLSYKLARRGSVRPSLLKGAGNAIVPEVAAAFIQAFYSLKP